MSLILYGAPLSPFVRKVEVLLREKGAEFESEPVNIMPMPDWFKEISPAKRIPVLRDLSVGREGARARRERSPTRRRSALLPNGNFPSQPSTLQMRSNSAKLRGTKSGRTPNSQERSSRRASI
ncbi:MAG: glutathione S-transferase family protein [Myxococcota bacterium]|nr:glutathione S-transferase family protein [Myxococcota bacterium]